MSKDQDEFGGNDEIVDGFTGETSEMANTGVRQNNLLQQSKRKKTKLKSKSTARSDPTRRDPDQEQIHFYAKIINDPVHERALNSLDSKLKAKVIKFLKVEEKLHNFCKEHNFNYEEPTNESDFSRRQRVKCRINYHLKKGKKKRPRF